MALLLDWLAALRQLEPLLSGRPLQSEAEVHSRGKRISAWQPSSCLEVELQGFPLLEWFWIAQWSSAPQSPWFTHVVSGSSVVVRRR